MDELVKRVREAAEKTREELRVRAKEMSFGTTRATREQGIAMVSNILMRYPPQVWMNEKTGEMIYDSAMMATIRDNPNVVNGKEVWREIERVLKGGR